MLRKSLLAALVALAVAALGVTAAFAYSTPAPKNFWKKNYRLSVALEDVQDLTFDAELEDVPGSVPRQARYYLQENLGDGTFEIDASAAKCFEVTSDDDGNQTTHAAGCDDVAALVDDSADGLCASLLGKPTHDENGELAFRAKKLVVWVS
jgi:hypothetical protein